MNKSKIRRVLIANRGEIAIRIERACKALEIDSVTIVSEADSSSLFARMARKAVLIGPAPAAQSYLNIERIIQVALENDCDALHPGYGFLSENADFARLVRAAGITFIGPSTEAISIMGSKTAARSRVTEYGVPCTPGASGGLTDDQLRSEAIRIGFPVIIKAVAGGGGRGMRIVRNEGEIKELLPRARSEAKKNFSSDDVFIEKYIEQPRHIEVQIFGDHYGSVVHFGTRDCSTQRRHQKLIEEAPAPFLSNSIRDQIHQAAINAARSVNYTNAGTCEFLLSGSEFYFLEMNTRIQVEHPVTEQVTKIDLVATQLLVEMGEKLPEQNEIKCSGHSIEYRIYAEDPKANFRPAVGRIASLKRPSGDGVREDFAFDAGDEVNPYYDAMISKLIISGKDRKQAIDRSKQALKEYELSGVPTTIPFHRWLLTRPSFLNRCVDIGFIDRECSDLSSKLEEFEAAEILDPLHKSSFGGIEPVEFCRYSSQAFDSDYLIEIVHKHQGYFVVRPIGADGTRAPNAMARASNGLQTALNALISEVLEQKAPQDIFEPV